MKKLLEKRNDLLEQAKSLIQQAKEETRALNEEENKAYEALVGEIRSIDSTIRAEEEQRKLELKEGDNMDHTEELELRAFEGFLRGQIDETRALDVGNNGTIIPQVIANRIIEEVKELSPIYSMATIYNVGGDLIFPYYDESTDTGAALVEDMTELTESTGKFTTIKLQNYIVGVLKKVSKSLLNRTDFDLVSFIVHRVAQDITVFLERACLVGESGKYEGVYATKNIVTSAASAAITSDELIDLQMAVPQIYQPKACFIMHKDTLKVIRKLKDANGQYLLNKDVTMPFGWSLLGKPVYISDNAPKMEAGKTAVVYGDMSGLYVKLAQNMEIQVLQEKYATQHAIGVCAYVEFDSKIVEAKKLAGLQMKAGE